MTTAQVAETTTVLFRTVFTQMITLSLIMIWQVLLWYHMTVLKKQFYLNRHSTLYIIIY